MSANRNYPGYLIVFEGIDGAGKSTQANWLQQALEKKGCKVVRSKEPTEGQFGKLLRDSMTKGRLSLQEELDLFIKDRQEHVETLIKPSLVAGKVVIIDRYYFSTAAYQGARGMDPEDLLRQNEAFAPQPDLLFFIDIDPSLGLKRISIRGDLANHFEELATLTKAREIFLAISRPYKVVIDGKLSKEEVQKQILSRTSKMIE